MKSTLTNLMSKKASEVRQIVAGLDASNAPRGLRRRFEKIRSKAQGGFTLLELLVVVAIMAVIGAAATAMLEDIDRKAAAGAHVEIMNDLMRNIEQYRIVNNGVYPTNWDSLLRSTGNNLTIANAAIPTASTTDFGLDSGITAMLAEEPLTDAIATALIDSGITSVQVINGAAANDPNAGNPGDCSTLANIRTMIAHKGSDVTNGSIFMTNAAGQDRGGCAAAVTITAPGGAAVDDVVRLAASENYRVGAGATDILVAMGVGPSMSMFGSNLNNAGEVTYHMTGAPYYRHVDGLTYNRFVALFNVGTVALPYAVARLQAVIDGSGDTKEEELGEWDNTRSTL